MPLLPKNTFKSSINTSSSPFASNEDNHHHNFFNRPTSRTSVTSINSDNFNPPTMMDISELDASAITLHAGGSRPQSARTVSKNYNNNNNINSTILSSPASGILSSASSCTSRIHRSHRGTSAMRNPNNTSSNLSMAAETSRRLKNFQSVAADKASFLCGQLVADSIVPKKSKQQQQQDEVNKFKLEVCTPRRQRLQQQRQQHQQQQQNESYVSHHHHEKSVHFVAVPPPPSSSSPRSAAATTTRNPSARRATIALEAQNRNKKGTESIDTVKSQIETFVMSFASEQQRYDRRRKDLEKEKVKQRMELSTSLRNHENNKPDSTTKSGTTSTTHTRTVHLTADELHKRDADNKNNSSALNNDNEDDDDRSSTDSAIIDPAVVTATITRNSQRRTNRLRDRFSASLETLNQTASNVSQIVLSSGSGGGGGGDSSCVLMSYLIGLERLVQFAFNTLGSKDELQAVIEGVSGLAGLQETAQSFGRFACFTKDSLSYRLEKVLPVKYDRYALFDAFGGVLRDGRVVHACLLSALRLMFFAPSPAHFTEFILTILFVHQTSLSQADCQTLYRILTNPHPLRFLVRGRQDNTHSSLHSVQRSFSPRNRNKNTNNSNSSMLLPSSAQSLYSAACDVDRKVAGEELYFLIDFLSTATTLPGTGGGCTISWVDLQRLVSPNDDGLVSNNSIVSNATSEAGTVAKTPQTTLLSSKKKPFTLATADDKPLSSTEKEIERKKEQAMLMQRKHDVAMALRRKAAGNDVFASTTNKRKSPAECVVIAKLMSEMKNP